MYGSAPPPPQVPSNHYDFIVNYGKQPGRSWLVTTSLRTRIAIVAGGTVTLLLVFWIVVALLSSSSTANTNALISLTQQQNELIRISQVPASRATLQPTQNFAMTAELTLQTDQQSFISLLTKLHTTPSPTVLKQTASALTYNQLKTAQTAGTYDQTYIHLAQTQLTAYTASLQALYKSTSGQIERQLLSQAYTHAEQLLTLSNQSE